MFTFHLGNLLEDMSDENKSDLWERWLNKYLELRIHGITNKLSNGELEAILEWALSLEVVFPKFVSLYCSGTTPKLEHARLFYHLKSDENNLTEKYPDDVARLLIHLTQGEEMPSYFWGELEELALQIKNAKGDFVLLKWLCDNLSRIGCVNALNIYDELTE